MKKWLLVMIVGALLSGCHLMDAMTDGFRHTGEVADDLKASVGSKPFVGFNWSNGSLIQVTVLFKGIPTTKTAEQIAALSRSSIRTHFQQQPKRIIISFDLPGNP